MNELQSTIVALLPPQKKTTPSGWISFNAVCCSNRGQGRDNRSRGGILLSSDGFQYHCFNCNFKAGWSPGKLISSNTKNLFKWFGMNETDIGKLGLYALKLKEDLPVETKELNFELKEYSLPELTLPVTQWLQQDLPSDILSNISKIIDYVTVERGMNIDWYDWHYSHSQGYRDRVIIPFYHQSKIVGFTGRKITNGKPKYLTDSQPGYVFNLDSQIQRKFVIVVEGQFDAIAIDGCAIMTNEPNNVQISRINALACEVIAVPDKDRAGSKLLNTALSQGWSASSPDWGNDVKDVADAVKQFGRVYTLYSILKYKESSQLKIKLLQKKLEKIHA